MKTAFTRAAALSAASIVALAAGSAAAQTLDIGEIVITPSRTPQEASKVGSTVSTVSEEQIEEQALPLAVEYLDLLPGISVSPGGGLSSEPSVSLRGAPRRYIKTLYNGIDISDPTSTQVQTSYQYLLGDNLAGIEVLKGSQSTLYGSDAIAGVISFSTLGEIEDGVTHLFHGEGGSFGSVRGSYGLRAANADSRLSLNLAGYRTDGISAAASGTERDGYENVSFDAAGEHRFSDVFSVFGSLLYIDANGEYDQDRDVDFSGVPTVIEPFDNPFNTNDSRLFGGRVGAKVDLMDGRLRNTVSIQGLRTDRAIRSRDLLYGSRFDADYAGERVKVDYQGEFDATDWLLLLAGVDHERQSAATSSVFDDGFGGVFPSSGDFSAHNTGLWTEAILEPLPDLTFTLGLRHDRHSQFGDYTTYRTSGSYTLAATGTRLHSSLGTGFRAPSLYELYDASFGNDGLQPETSVSFDIGVEQPWLDGRLVSDVTYFRTEIDDLIAFSGGSFNRVPGTSRLQGVEASATWEATPSLDLTAAYTYTEALDASGARLPRVPRHAIGLTALVTPAEKWTVSATARIAVDTIENIIVATDYSSGPVSLDDYVLVNAKVTYQATDSTEIYLRGENLLDQDYQTSRGFNAPPLSVFAGFRSKIGP